MKNSMKFYRTALIALIGATSSAIAAPFTITNGDLILGFQATGGEGSGVNVFFNLGSAVSHRNNGNLGFLGNIATTLSGQYGAGWYSRTDLYFGVIGNLNSQPNTGIGSRAAVDGDPSRTVYVSQNTLSPGQGLLWTGYSTSALGTAGNDVSGLEGMLPLLTANTDGSATLNQTSQSTEWNNGWTTYNPVPGGGFHTFNGGIQQSFGKGGSATYVDVQRVLSTNTGAVPTGVVGGGTYETTISISATGGITALTSTPASPYDTWINSFASLTLPADKLPTADPDGDGFNNLEEFAFGGTPNVLADKGTYLPQTVDANGDSMPDLSLTIEARTGATFAASGNKLTATVDGITYRIEGSTDLIDWNSPVSEVTQLGSGSPSAGYGFKSFRLNAASGLADKGFLRAVLVK